MNKSIIKSMLVSLLLIGMLSLITGCFEGKEIYDNAKDVIEESQAGIDAMAVEMINSQFKIYEKEKASSSVVKALIENVISNNTTINQKIKVEYISNTWEGDMEVSSDVDDLNSIISFLNNDKKYKIELSEYSKNGLISLITITEL